MSERGDDGRAFMVAVVLAAIAGVLAGVGLNAVDELARIADALERAYPVEVAGD